MQKKLLAVAVAGALASPLAMAQSAVTISGVFKVGLDQIRISNPAAARAGNNKSETRVTDNSSRIIFGITEDIGGGLAGIAQLDVRPQLDDAGETNVAAGNSWVGIRSSNLGTVTLGRHDLHYGKQPDETASQAGALQAAAVSLMDYVSVGGAAVAIAGATRTPNVVRYDSPNWSGFAFTGAYSTNPGQEADLSTGIRKGNAWNFNPSYTTSNWQVGWSTWRQKADAGGATSDQKSNVLYGYMRFGAFKVGLAMNDSEVESNAGVKAADRRAWSIPVAWAQGSHHVAGHYTVARDDKVQGNNTGAKMIAIAYSYLLSKRTSVGVTYASLNNDPNAAYNFFTNVASLGSTQSTLGAGEDGRLVALTVRHAF